MQKWDINNDAGQFVRFQEVGEDFVSKRMRLYHRREVCPLCHKQITKGNVILAITNQVRLPNVVMHESCFKTHTPEGNLAILQHRYEDAKSMLSRVIPWFGIEGVTQRVLDEHVKSEE